MGLQAFNLSREFISSLLILRDILHEGDWPNY